MMRSKGSLTFIAILGWASLAAAAPVNTVAIVQGEIVVDPQGATLRVLTHDGKIKSNPLWSKGGSLIAYLEGVPRETGLARIVVISETGQQKFAALVAAPASPDATTDVH